MYRGTTPTLTFQLPIDTGSITVLSIAVGIVSGLAATGINQAVKQLSKGE